MFEDNEYYGHIEVGVKAKYLIPMHYSYKDQTPFWVENSYPNTILFSDSMETWELLLDTTSEALGEIVSFTAEDGTRLYGTLIGDGEPAVILAHQGNRNQTSWHTFAQLLADEGFTALTFDFRGGGQSGGKRVIGQVIHDLNAAVAFLRERGYQEIVCVGASLGGTACLRAALDDGLVGLVVFASTLSVGAPTETKTDELADLNIPKLFLSASDDTMVVTDINRMYEYSIEPKELHIFQDMSEHGTDLFDTNVGDELTDILLTFIKGLEN
jgi:alpha/beta superfamily hydrolase